MNGGSSLLINQLHFSLKCRILFEFGRSIVFFKYDPWNDFCMADVWHFRSALYIVFCLVKSFSYL
jgi:hypothetical protein